MRAVFLVLLVIVSQANAASESGSKGAGRDSSAPGGGRVASAGSASHGGGGGRMNRWLDPRNVPPLAADRKVNEQDCSKPIDWTAGNLKCK